MKVEQLHLIAMEFLEKVVFQNLDFASIRGAYIMGGLASKSKEEEFETEFRDIDLAVVIDDTKIPIEKERYPHGKFSVYQGIMFQVILLSETDLREKLFTMLGLGSNLRHNTLLYDQNEFLATAVKQLELNWGSKKWLNNRIERSSEFIFEYRDTINLETRDWTLLTKITQLVNMLSGHIAISSLNTPTHRRSLALSHSILFSHNKLELQELMLKLNGFSNITKNRTIELLNTSDSLLKRFLNDHANRLEFEDGSSDPEVNRKLGLGHKKSVLDIIDDGLHREAIPTIIATYAEVSELANFVGTDEEKNEVANILKTEFGDMINEVDLSILDQVVNTTIKTGVEFLDQYGK